jgi:hypothetical protein
MVVDVYAGQYVHVVAPASLLYMPTGHTKHAPSYAYVPASHATQSSELSWSAARSPDVPYPAAHAVHAVEPAASLYCPAGHTSHRPVLDDRYVPAAHASQSSELSWSVVASPEAEEPAGHCVHVAEPAASLYWPAGHTWHAVGSWEHTTHASS